MKAVFRPRPRQQIALAAFLFLSSVGELHAQIELKGELKEVFLKELERDAFGSRESLEETVEGLKKSKDVLSRLDLRVVQHFLRSLAKVNPEKFKRFETERLIQDQDVYWTKQDKKRPGLPRAGDPHDPIEEEIRKTIFGVYISIDPQGATSIWIGSGLAALMEGEDPAKILEGKSLKDLGVQEWKVAIYLKSLGLGFEDFGGRISRSASKGLKVESFQGKAAKEIFENIRGFSRQKEIHRTLLAWGMTEVADEGKVVKLPPLFKEIEILDSWMTEKSEKTPNGQLVRGEGGTLGQANGVHNSLIPYLGKRLSEIPVEILRAAGIDPRLVFYHRTKTREAAESIVSGEAFVSLGAESAIGGAASWGEGLYVAPHLRLTHYGPYIVRVELSPDAVLGRDFDYFVGQGDGPILVIKNPKMATEKYGEDEALIVQAARAALVSHQVHQAIDLLESIPRLKPETLRQFAFVKHFSPLFDAYVIHRLTEQAETKDSVTAADRRSINQRLNDLIENPELITQAEYRALNQFERAVSRPKSIERLLKRLHSDGVTHSQPDLEEMNFEIGAVERRVERLNKLIHQNSPSLLLSAEAERAAKALANLLKIYKGLPKTNSLEESQFFLSMLPLWYNFLKALGSAKNAAGFDEHSGRIEAIRLEVSSLMAEALGDLVERASKFFAANPKEAVREMGDQIFYNRLVLEGFPLMRESIEELSAHLSENLKPEEKMKARQGISFLGAMSPLRGKSKEAPKDLFQDLPRQPQLEAAVQVSLETKKLKAVQVGMQKDEAIQFLEARLRRFEMVKSIDREAIRNSLQTGITHRLGISLPHWPGQRFYRLLGGSSGDPASDLMLAMGLRNSAFSQNDLLLSKIAQRLDRGLCLKFLKRLPKSADPESQ